MQNRKFAIFVGLFTSMASLALLGLILYVCYQRGLFEKQITYQLTSNNGNGLQLGMPVIYSGFAIGKVVNIDLADDGQITATITISKQQSKWLRETTQFTLEKPLLSAAYIAVTTQELNSSILKPNSRRPFSTYDGLEDVIARVNEVVDDLKPVAKSLQRIVFNVESFTKKIADENGSFNITLANLEKVSSKISSHSNVLAGLTGNEALSLNLVKSIKTLSTFMNEMLTMSKQLQTTIAQLNDKVLGDNEKALINNVNRIFLDIKNKLKKIDGIFNEVGKFDKGLGDDINFMRGQIKVNLKNLNKILSRINNVLVDESKEITLP